MADSSASSTSLGCDPSTNFSAAEQGPALTIAGHGSSADASPSEKPAKAKRDPAVPKKRADTYLDQWAHGKNGTILFKDYDGSRAKATVTYIIQQAKVRFAKNGKKPFPAPKDREAAISSLPRRGIAKVALMTLDLAAESTAAKMGHALYKDKTSNARSTAWRSEVWAAACFGLDLHTSGDAPGTDAYAMFGDTMEFVSVKSLGKHGFCPQLSSFTAHGTRDACDLQAMLDSIGLCAWFVVVDTTLLPEAQLMLIPAEAVADWARAGLINNSGVGAELLAKLVAASCEIAIVEPPPIDQDTLAKANKLAAELDAKAMQPALDQRKLMIEQLVAASAPARAKPM